MTSNKENRQFFGVLLGIFSIFLLWSAFTSFEKNPSYTNLTMLVGLIFGLICLAIAYMFLSE